MLTQHDTNLWSVETELAWQAGLIRIPIRMTVVRLSDGRLILHSPVSISAALKEELDRLGTVAFIVIPEAHGKFAAEAARAYPGAELLAAPSPPGGRESLAFRGSLADDPPAAWAGQVETHLLRGFRLHEVVLFVPAARTLVITDLCFNVRRSESRVARAFFRANGMWQYFGPSRLIRALTVSDRAAFQQSLARVLAWDFERVVPSHGDVLERGGPAAIRAAWPAR